MPVMLCLGSLRCGVDSRPNRAAIVGGGDKRIHHLPGLVPGVSGDIGAKETNPARRCASDNFDFRCVLDAEAPMSK
jgi:hypothetical protein